MIQSYQDKKTRLIAGGGTVKGFPPDLIRRTRAMLTALNAAHALSDLRFPPGNHLEKLSGDRKGQHSVRINKQWRICFFWTNAGPEDVEVVDYH